MAPDSTGKLQPPTTHTQPPTTRTQPRRHGSVPRGMDPLAPAPPVLGAFGRLFGGYVPPDYKAESVRLLAQTMISPAEDDKDLDVPDEDQNESIPAGYTYLGQFIDHDITFDPVSSLQQQNDPYALVDFRTPKFDLDSVYGRGPADQPYLYSPPGVLPVPGGQLSIPAGLKLLLGPPVSSAGTGSAAFDVPRNAVRNPDTGKWQANRALIGDPRNDENLIISQLHRVFLQFHNALVDHHLMHKLDDKEVREQKTAGAAIAELQDCLENGDWCNAFFEDSQRLVRWHYQWLVVHDFLPLVCGQEIVDEILGNRGAVGQPLLMFYPSGGGVFVPVEFSAAAYRFGHSMVRPSYFINDVTRARRVELKQQPLRTPILGPGSEEPLANLDGFRPLPDDGVIEWKYFFRGFADTTPDGKPLPQFSYKIDTHLANPLGSLPSLIVTDGSHSLAERNLQRGQSLGLPSGQWLAWQMGMTPLTDAQLGVTTQELRKRCQAAQANFTDKEIAAAASDFERQVPLWYYVLREAELPAAAGGGDGARLGRLGGRLVAGVLLGLLAADPQSYLRAKPDFEPDPAFKVGRDKFDMTALISFATRESTDSPDEVRNAMTTTSETYTAMGQDLGPLILEGVPYRYDANGGSPRLIQVSEGEQKYQDHTTSPLLAREPAAMYAVVDGPARDHYDKNPLTAEEEKKYKEDPSSSLWWHFGGKFYRVTKAIKVPYEVKQGGETVTKHILIGYMGIDGGGGG